jgi:hypothetical protein
MNLLDQSAWWLIPFILLILVMVHAMLEFTVSLLARPSRRKLKPIPAAQLRERLLTLNAQDKPFQLTVGADCDLEIRSQAEEASHTARFAFARSVSSSHIRFLFDETRHEVRINQVSQSRGLALGFARWLPYLHGSLSFQSGPPGQFFTEEFSHIAERGGWGVRPVLWWFQTTYRGYRFLERLTPPPFRRWPARRFWGCLYPLSYFAGMGYFAAILGPEVGPNLGLILGISAAWWGVWAFLTWALLGFPPFWRRWRT